MKKIDFFIIIACFISLLFIIQSVSGLNANSSNYSVGRFNTGMATFNASSENYESVSVSESQGTTRNAESDSYTSNIGFFDNTPYYRTVSITSYSIYPTSAVQGSIIRLSSSALNSESVWAVLTLPNSTQETIAMNNNQYSYYTADLVGQYTVTFYANSSQGNLASVIDNFDITPPVIPPVVQPPSKEETKIIIEKCTYVWDCTSWSICSNEIQIRECKNIGNCTGTEGKPIETRVCSDALFDVVMEFKDVKLTTNKTLNFDINLTETKGIEKIDVQIKYSIINSNNTEIFSQIETRAIQGNLSFEKEITELNLINGEYILRVDILYGNLQRAFAEQKFEVIKKEIEIVEPTKKRFGDLFEKINYNAILLFILLILGSFFILLAIFLMLKRWSSIYAKIKEIIGKIKEKFKREHFGNTLGELLNKKVYSSDGDFIGEVKEVILGKDRICSLMITLDEKYNSIGKGIIVDYKNVKSIKNVVIIDKEVLSFLK